MNENNTIDDCYFLKGKISYLRPLLKKDIIPEYLAWLNNPDLVKYSSHFRTWPTTEMDLDSFLDKTKSENHIVFAACDIKNNIHFGNVSLDKIDWVNRNAHFNAMIGRPEYRTLHYIDILKIIMEYAFNTLNLNKLSGGTEIPGLPEWHERLGWTIEGKLRKQMFRNGKYVDITLVGVLREDYLKKK